MRVANTASHFTIDQKGIHGQTLLHAAVKAHDSAEVERLLKAGFSPFVEDDDSLTAVDLCLQYGHFDLLPTLLSSVLPKELEPACSKIGTPEAERRCREISYDCKKLVGSALQNLEKDWKTPGVDSILLSPHIQVLEQLPTVASQERVDFNKRSAFGLTRLQEYLLQPWRSKEAKHWIFASQGNIDWSVTDEQAGNNVLHLAVITGNLEMVNYLLSRGEAKEWVKEQNKAGMTVLHLAICSPYIPDNKKAELVDRFLALGVDLSLQDKEGFTAAELVGALAHAKDPLQIDSKEWKILYGIALLWLAIAAKEQGLLEGTNTEWLLDLTIGVFGFMTDASMTVLNAFAHTPLIAPLWTLISAASTATLDPLSQLCANAERVSATYKNNLAALNHLKGRPLAALKRLFVTNVQALHGAARLVKSVRYAVDSSLRSTPLSRWAMNTAYKVTHATAADLFWGGFDMAKKPVRWLTGFIS